MAYLVVFLGGGVGSVLRLMLSAYAERSLQSGFPFGILIVNLTGAFAIGLVTELSALTLSVSPLMRTFLVTGLLGGFTTFSAFSLETALMWTKGDYLNLGLYIAASVIGTIALALMAMTAVRSLIGS